MVDITDLETLSAFAISSDFERRFPVTEQVSDRGNRLFTWRFIRFSSRTEVRSCPRFPDSPKTRPSEPKT